MGTSADHFTGGQRHTRGVWCPSLAHWETVLSGDAAQTPRRADCFPRMTFDGVSHQADRREPGNVPIHVSRQVHAWLRAHPLPAIGQFADLFWPTTQSGRKGVVGAPNTLGMVEKIEG